MAGKCQRVLVNRLKKKAHGWLGYFVVAKVTASKPESPRQCFKCFEKVTCPQAGDDVILPSCGAELQDETFDLEVVDPFKMGWTTQRQFEFRASVQGIGSVELTAQSIKFFD